MNMDDIQTDRWMLFTTMLLTILDISLFLNQSLTLKLNLGCVMQVNAKELRQHLSEYLDRASRGETLDISMRGKPVARLTRIESHGIPEQDNLFGIWSDMDEMDVGAHIRDLRQGRRF